jgi:hypothetical protein
MKDPAKIQLAKQLLCISEQHAWLSYLYTTYINDLPLNINVDSKILLFADDTSVLTIANNLQDLQTNTSILNQMNKWSIANGLSLNIDKTNVIHIKWNHLQDSPFQISYQNVKTKEVTNTKLLGLCLDQHMEWKTHIDLIITIYIQGNS